MSFFRTFVPKIEYMTEMNSAEENVNTVSPDVPTWSEDQMVLRSEGFWKDHLVLYDHRFGGS